MDKSDIAILIEALCDGPLNGAEPSAELQAFRRAAAEALRKAGAGRDSGYDSVADGERLTAALAALLSGSDRDAARQTLADLAMRSSAARLDAESAAAFVDALERSAHPAPPHLVEQLLATEPAAGIRGHGAAPSFWSRIADRILAAQRWRVVAALMLVLLASAASWSLQWREPGQVASPAPPVATRAVAPAAAVDARLPPQSSLAAAPTVAPTPTCNEPTHAGETAKLASRLQDSAEKARADAAAGCSPTPSRQLATDAAAKDALHNAEQAEPAAAASAAVDSSTQMKASRMREPSQGGRLDRTLRTTDRPAPARPEPSPTAPPPAASVLSR